MAMWTHQPQEQGGEYFFSGAFYVTAQVKHALSDNEIRAIYEKVQQLVKKENGCDYLQTFLDEEKRKLFFIDQLSKSMIESGEFKPEHNHCTLMFSHEY